MSLIYLQYMLHVSFVRSFMHSFLDSFGRSFGRSWDWLFGRSFDLSFVDFFIHYIILTAPFKPRLWRTLSGNTANFCLPNHPHNSQLFSSFETLANASSSSSGSCDCVAIASTVFEPKDQNSKLWTKISKNLKTHSVCLQKISKFMDLWHALSAAHPNLQCCEGSIWSLHLPVAVGLSQLHRGRNHERHIPMSMEHSYQCCRRKMDQAIDQG